MDGHVLIDACDVQAARRKAGKRTVDARYGSSDCATYRDQRELLACDDIDAVLIATGDNINVSMVMHPTLVLGLYTQYGPIEISVALKEQETLVEAEVDMGEVLKEV